MKALRRGQEAGSSVTLWSTTSSGVRMRRRHTPMRVCGPLLRSYAAIPLSRYSVRGLDPELASLCLFRVTPLLHRPILRPHEI